MIIGIPRFIIVGIGALFSIYHVVLGTLTLGVPRDDAPVIAAMAIYLIATGISLVRRGPARMPIWMAALNVAIAVTLPLLVTGELDPAREGGNGYATWYVAAIGTLMAITSTRRRHLFAWVGIAFLVVQTVEIGRAHV